jgi:hypothetical protein
MVGVVRKWWVVEGEVEDGCKGNEEGGSIRSWRRR